MPFTMNVIEEPPCDCSWDYTAISWGDGPGQACSVQNGESLGTLPITPGAEIKIFPIVSCEECGFPKQSYTWSITESGNLVADGECLVEDLPITFTPPNISGWVTYDVTLSAKCGNTICPQQWAIHITVQMVPSTCMCQYGVFVRLGGHMTPMVPAPCGYDFGPIQVCPGATINIPTSVSCWNCGASEAQSYNWSITTSTGQIITSGNSTHIPIISFLAPSTPGTVTYTFTLDASCDNTTCPQCIVPITINVVETTPCISCMCQKGDITIIWGNEEDQRWSGPCGGGSNLIQIPELAAGTAVQVIASDNCTGTSCQPPTYDWLVWAWGQPVPFTLNSDNSSISFVPDVRAGIHTVRLNTFCVNSLCSQCNISINIQSIGRSKQQATVEPCPAITAFTASSMQVAPGETVMLYWTITGSGDAFLTCGGERRSVPLTGSMAVTPPQSGCCTLSVSNSCGSDQKTQCITVIQLPPIRPPVTPPETPPQPPTPPPPQPPMPPPRGL
jgi:hypothetical protein